MKSPEVLGIELSSFAIALTFLALGGLTARLVQMPLLLGYLMAGIFAQALLPLSPSLLLLGSIGVMLLLFFLGMEFDWKRLFNAPRRLLITLLDFTLNFLLPFFLLWLSGLPFVAAFIVAMAFYPTSSAITISALMQMRRLANPETETIIWMLIGEDLAIVLLLAIASGLIGAGTGLSNILVGFGFITGMVVAAIMLTRPLEWLFAHVPAELDNLVMLSVIVIVSAIAHVLNLSEALGAFLAGMVFSGVRDRHELEQRLHLLRDLGTAVFFFTFGLQALLRFSAEGILLGLGLLLSGIISKTVTAWSSAPLDNLRPRARRRFLLSLWIRGEFSIIALLLGKSVLPPVWQEAVSWFIIGSAVVGILAIATTEKIAGLHR